MMETVNYYNFNRSNVYVLLLDATKAFYQVKYCKLFRELSNRHMSPLVIRLLMYMYTNLRLRVRWGDEMYGQFGVVVVVFYSFYCLFFCLYILLYSQQILTPRVFKIEGTITIEQSRHVIKLNT